MSQRLFAALDVPDEVAARALKLMRGVPGAKWRPRDNLHITLRFFGDTPEPVARDLDSELDQIALATAPLPIKLKSAGWFGREDPHTLYLGVDGGAALNQLASQCERAARRCGLKADTRGFTPHMTVAYLSASDVRLVQGFCTRLALFESEPWTVSGFSLASSWRRDNAPSLYRAEAEYVLMG
jgi:RNA 2',3'-cyclic 3'-phosphodiesterase